MEKNLEKNGNDQQLTLVNRNINRTFNFNC